METSDVNNTILKWVASPYYFAGGLDERIVEELNRSLREDYGCDFQIEFEWIEAAGWEYEQAVKEKHDKGEQADILFTGLANAGETGSYDVFVKAGLLYPIEELLHTMPEGKELYDTFSSAFWQSMKSQGKIYGFRCVDPQLYYDAVLLANASYALEEGEEELSLLQMGDILEQMYRQNPGQFEGTVGLYVHPTALCVLEGYIPVDYGGMGLYFVEEDGVFRVVSAAEDESFLNMWKEIKRCNMWSDHISMDSAYAGGKFIFAAVSANLMSLWEESFYNGNIMLPVKVLRSFPQAVTYPQNAVTGIASWSRHPEEALQFLTLIVTQEKLSNLLTYGIEGVHYELVDGTVKALPGEKRGAYQSPASVANRMITYPVGLEPSDKLKIYQERNRAAQLSPDVKFGLDYTAYDAKVTEISEIYRQHMSLWYGQCEDMEAEVEALRAELKSAGITQLLEQLNEVLYEKQQENRS